MENQTNIIVKVKVIVGQPLHFPDGTLKSYSQLITLRYNTPEWKLFLTNILRMGWGKVDVFKCLDGNKKITEGEKINHPEIDIPGNIQKEIDAAMAVNEKPLTPEQKEIKELKEQVAALVSASKKPAKKEVIKKDNTPNVNEELEAARDKYFEVLKEKPHHAKGLPKLNEEIEAELNK